MMPDPVARPRLLSFLARNWIALASIAIVLAYVALIEQVWTWSKLFAEWQAIGIGRVAAAMAVLLMTQMVRSIRIYDYFADVKGRFWRLFRVVQLHNLINILLPFRSGEASFPLLMRSEFAVPLAQSSAALLWMRLLDLHALLCVAGLALIDRTGHGRIGLVLWLAFCCLPLAAMAVSGRGAWMIGRIRSHRLKELARQAQAGLPETRGRFLRAWAMTVVNWFSKLLAIAWILALLGVVPWQAAIGGSVGGELSSVLPFHAPAGVGTYPAGITAGALAFGAGNSEDGLSLLARAAVNAHILVFVSALASTALSLLGSTGRRGAVKA